MRLPSVGSLPSVRELASAVKPGRIAVLMGGNSAEREISLRSGQAVLEALRSAGLPAYGVDLRGWPDLEILRKQRPAAAMICLHGPGGEDGSLQGALDWMGIPYTGSGQLASALAMDKHRAKQVMNAVGVPTPAGGILRRGAAEWPKGIKLPAVLKPNRQGSAIGVSILRRRDEFPKALRKALQYGSEVLLEEFCAGMEITVGILGDRVLPVIEIVPQREFYDYEAKYRPGLSEHIVPARLPAKISRRAEALARAAHEALGCRGVSRVDLIVGTQGLIRVLEVNTIPGMTETSLLPDAARHAGISFEALCIMILLEAWRERA